jgi:hypothetical protein
MQSQNTAKPREAEQRRLHVIDCKRNRSKVNLSVTGMNQGVRASVLRVALDSDIDEVPTMRKAANRAGVNEPQALAVVRQYVYDLRTQIYELKSRLQPPPSGPAGAARRVA